MLLYTTPKAYVDDITVVTDFVDNIGNDITNTSTESIQTLGSTERRGLD